MSDLTPDQLARLQAAHSAFDRDHAAERDKLLAALPATPPAVPLSLWRRGRQMVRSNWAKGMVAAVLAVAAFGVWQVVQPPTAFGQVAKAMRAAGGYTLDISTVVPKGGKDVVEESGTMTVTAAGDTRMTTGPAGNPDEVAINFVGKPGIDIDHKNKSYQKTDPDAGGPNPILSAMTGLAKYTGAGDDLGTKAVAGVRAKGYSVDLKLIVSGAPDKATMELWLDPKTNRPVRIDFLDVGGEPGTRMRLENFRWGNVDDKLFDATPPAGYKDVTPKPPGVEEITAEIVRGLRTYHKYAGHYPKGKYVYGDTTRDELFAAAGFVHNPGRPAKTDEEKAEIATDKWVECSNAHFGWINEIQRKNPDAAYFGKTVTAADTGKVLFRWKLDGDYRVIFGDLSSETVSGERLKALEK